MEELATLQFCTSRGDGEVAPIESSGEAVAFSVGDRIGGRYVLESWLGGGNMGDVYLARDDKLAGRPVAIKVVSNRSRKPSDQLQKELAREACIGANLQHPCIATVLDFGEHEEKSFTVFEYVEGENLRAVLKRRKVLPLAEVGQIIRALAKGLDFVHAAGIVHRDIKPENVGISKSGDFKILDLGLAADFQNDALPGSYSGTPAYSSPEQASCEPTNGRSDQYSLAVIAYEMLAGKRPFQGSTAAQVLLHQITKKPACPTTHAEDLSDIAAAAIRKALSKKPEDRFSTCQEFAAELVAELASEQGERKEKLFSYPQQDRLSFTICHAGEDSILARKLAAGLEQNNFACWYYERDALPGLDLFKQVKSALQRSEAVVLLVSRGFIQSPDLVRELNEAHELGCVFFPVLIDMSTEEFAANQPQWRPLLGASALVEFSRRFEADALVTRMVGGANGAGINQHPPQQPYQVPARREVSGQIWATDANQIDIHDLERVVYRTDIINDYLQRQNRAFLSASKGLGKTLLLTYKRSLLAKAMGGKDVTMVPQGRPYLDFMSEMRSLSQRYEKPLSELSNTKRFWSAAIRVSAISHQAGLIQDDETFELEPFPKRVARWLTGVKVQPTVVFKEFTSLTISDFNRLIDETENFLDQKLRAIHSGTYFFIDKVDQAIHHLSREAWINVQAGLIEAAWETMNANSHIKVFATIREEAFSNYQSDIKTNLLGATTRLQYSEDELADLMDNLAHCYEGASNFSDFVGFNVVRHSRRPEPEDSFQFVRRHTFGRPRDLVAIASEMSAKKSSLSEDRFCEIVRETSATGLVSNIFDEVTVFLDCLQDRDARQRFLAEIPHNILERDEAIAVSETFNGLSPGTMKHFGENSGQIFHPFRDLYFAGLLGVLEANPETGQILQRYRQPHDLLAGAAWGLPDSEYYLIHPALYNYIAQHRTSKKFNVFQHMLLGQGLPWEPHYGIFCQIEKQLQHVTDPPLMSACYRLLSVAHTLLKSGQADQLSVTLRTLPQWQTIQNAPKAHDELVLWLEELSSDRR